MRSKPFTRILSLALFGIPFCGVAATGGEPVALSVRDLSLREKVGQLFVLRPDALEDQRLIAELENTSAAGTTEVTDAIRAKYDQYPCGGFALFRKNIVSPEQLKQFTQDLHGLNEKIPPLLAIDEEGGRVTRIAGHPNKAFNEPVIPSMGVLAAAGDPERVRETAQTIGTYLKEYGLDIDFAPVADVNTCPENPIMGDRAFGDDPEVAATMVRAYIHGLHDSGIASCIKHFPGHGDTSSDTHTGYAETLKTWEEISACEMLPFRAGIEAGTEFVMTAHISTPNVTGCALPATMSDILLTEKLRGELGFEGLIITDALAMGAVSNQYTSAEACVTCLKAGADLLLMPYDYEEAFEGVLRTVESGELTEERIDQSVERILKFKFRTH